MLGEVCAWSLCVFDHLGGCFGGYFLLMHGADKDVSDHRALLLL